MREMKRGTDKGINGEEGLQVELMQEFFEPIGCLVAVQLTQVKQTRGGLIVPDTAAPDAYEAVTGRVVSVGKDCKYLKRGDYVIGLVVSPGQTIVWQGWKVFMTREDHILGKLLSNLKEQGEAPASTPQG